MSHTPGPWTIAWPTGCNDGVRIDSPEGPVAFNVIDCSASLIAAAPELLSAARSALADLEGIVPEFEPSGDRRHPAWNTIRELQAIIAKAEGFYTGT